MGVLLKLVCRVCCTATHFLAWYNCQPSLSSRAGIHAVQTGTTCLDCELCTELNKCLVWVLTSRQLSFSVCGAKQIKNRFHWCYDYFMYCFYCSIFFFDLSTTFSQSLFFQKFAKLFLFTSTIRLKHIICRPYYIRCLATLPKIMLTCAVSVGAMHGGISCRASDPCLYTTFSSTLWDLLSGLHSGYWHSLRSQTPLQRHFIVA